tara:strand:+ start:96 stop:380 length:285 start_codon:yes stop_codon:yes gene_type:complete
MAKMKLTADHKRFHAWVMEKPCCVPDCQQPSIFHHQKQPFPLPRRDHMYGVNICPHHHSEYHDKLGSDQSFFNKYNINLHDIAYKNLYHWNVID